MTLYEFGSNLLSDVTEILGDGIHVFGGALDLALPLAAVVLATLALWLSFRPPATWSLAALHSFTAISYLVVWLLTDNVLFCIAAIATSIAVIVTGARTLSSKPSTTHR